jgi:hypothetical protein
MLLFMFKSEGNRGPHAFAPDPGGQELPARHGPWTAVRVVHEDKDPTYRMSRAAIEKSFADQGFQLYKMKRSLRVELRDRHHTIKARVTAKRPITMTAASA